MANKPGSRSLDSRTFQPKLRMFYNGNTDVNKVRSDCNSSVALAQSAADEPSAGVRFDETIGVQYEVGKRADWEKKLTDEIMVSVFVELNEAVPDDFVLPSIAEGRRTRRRGGIEVAEIPLAELEKYVQPKRITHVSLGEPLAAPSPPRDPQQQGVPAKSRWDFPDKARHKDGASVLIGLIDVHGFDFSHPDFSDGKGGTRFVAIWDQGGDVRDSPKGFGYGSEFRQEHLNQAIKDGKANRFPAWELEPQSQMVEGSHGTHVASIAAGNRGVCKKSEIAAVLISLPGEDEERRRSFYDSTRIAHAIDYLIDLADELDLPVSINISLGTNGHAHDASSTISRWIDNALAIPGRCVTVAAGNAGQEAATSADDIGYVMGRIHTSGRIASRGLNSVVDWVVVGDGISDLSENELEIWYSPQDRFEVEVRPPGGNWIGPIKPGEYVENRQLPAPRKSFVSIYNELYHPINGCNYISIYLSPFLNPAGIVGIPPGTWQVRLTGQEVRDGNYHGWIERDDPRRIGRLGATQAWSFPSFLAEGSFVDNSTVSSLACGHRVISVANFDDGRAKINITSSQGPTRDGRFKPDVGAPGTDVVAAKGFTSNINQWLAMTGTSMSSPFVAGVAGLMLAVNKNLSAAQIVGIIQSTSKPLPGNDYVWRNDAGFGVIDPKACLREAKLVGERKDRTTI